MGREECFVKDTELNTIHLTSNTIHLTFKKLFYEREKKINRINKSKYNKPRYL